MSQTKPLKPYRNRPLPPARGQVSVSGTAVAAGAAVSVAVSFGRTFTVPPFVFVSLAGAPGGSNYVVPRVSSVGPTGFTLYLYNTGPTAATWSDLAVNWQAIP